MAVPWYSNSAVNERTDKCPYEARYGLRVVRHELQAECQAVDIGAIIRDDAEGEDDEAELAEAS